MDVHPPQNGAIGSAPWPYPCKDRRTVKRSPDGLPTLRGRGRAGGQAVARQPDIGAPGQAARLAVLGIRLGCP